MLHLVCTLWALVWSHALFVGSAGDADPPVAPLKIEFRQSGDNLPLIFQVMPTLNTTEADQLGKAMCDYLLDNQIISASVVSRCLMKTRLLQLNLNPQVLKMIVLSITNAASLFVFFVRDLNDLDEWDAEVRLNVHMNRDSLARLVDVNSGDYEINIEDMEAQYVELIRPLIQQVMADQTDINEHLLFPVYIPSEFITPPDRDTSPTSSAITESGNTDSDQLIVNGVRYQRVPEVSSRTDGPYELYRPVFKYYDSILRSRNHAMLAQHAHPWSFLILDDILDAEIIRKVSQEIDHFARQRHDSYLSNWEVYFDAQQYKYSQRIYHAYGPETRRVLNELKAAPFLRYLERITGIAGLIADPFDKGAGMHVIEPGGFLDVHLDFPFHDHIKLFRRVNVLLYVNDEDWQEDWGSQLELWAPLSHLEKLSKNTSPVPAAELDHFTQAMQFQHDKTGNGHGVYSFRFEDLAIDSPGDVTEDPRRPGEYLGKAHTIVPRFNRMVVLVLSNESYHGHPHALRCPENRLRKSLAQYYYTSNALPTQTQMAQSTLFVAAKPR